MQKDMMLKKIEQANVMTQTGDSKINPINFSLFKLKTGWKEIRQNMIGLFLLALFISGVFLQTAFAQAPPSSTRPSGYQISYSGDVNYYNGNVSFNLPLLTVGGRGEASFTMIATVGDQKWSVDVTRELQYCNVPGNPQLCVYKNIYTPTMNSQYTPIKAGLGPGMMRAIHTGKYSSASCTGTNTAFYQRLTTIIFAMPGGGSVTLRDTLNDGKPMDASPCHAIDGPTRGTIFEAWDGSGITFVSDTALEDKWASAQSSPTGNLYFKNGVKYRIENGAVTKITDRNGNWVNFTYSDTNFPSSSSYTATDSIGRTVSVEGGLVTFKGTNGANRTIKVFGSGGLRSDYSQLTWSQAFPELNGAQRYTGLMDVSGIDRIELPDGRNYRFKYSPYSELARIELPTGGAIEYDWTKGYDSWGGSGAFAGSESTAYSWTAYGYVYRRAIEKRVYDNGASGANYSNKTTIQKPVNSTIAVVKEYEAGNSTPTSRSDHYYHGDPLSGFQLQDPFYPESFLTGMEYQTDVYAGDGAQLLRRRESSWQARTVPAWAASYNPNAGKDPRLVESKSTLADTNQVSKTNYGYDNFNNQTDIYEYDFGNGAPGAFVRRGHTDYVTDQNYLNVYLKSLPSQSWVSSDPDGTNIVSRSQIEYDNYVNDATHAAILPRANVVGHDSGNYSAGYPLRGNPTRVTSFANAANQSEPVSVFSQYDMLGNVVKVIDAKGNASTINYNDNFGAPNGEARTNSAPGQLNGQQTFAFPTSATNALGWTTYAQFDYFTGAGVDAEDLNGNVSSVFYNDLLDRPTQTIVANNTSLRSQTTIVYDDANRRIQSTSDLFAFGDNLAKSESFYDALGRTFESRTYKDGTYIASKKEFDQLGRVKRATNPYKPGETVLWTTTNYDALSRPISVTSPDGATVLIAYSGSSKTVTDQAGKKRKGTSDALGRMIQVIEDPNGQNLITDYVFDTVGNLRRTIQGEQNRYFMYDSLGRLLRAKQPEQDANPSLAATDPITGNTNWSVAYAYDANGNITSTMDARGISINGTYDNLNRLVVRDYSDTTPDVTFTYDGGLAPAFR
jgi:YD repeat-containing protein